MAVLKSESNVEIAACSMIYCIHDNFKVQHRPAEYEKISQFSISIHRKWYYSEAHSW